MACAVPRRASRLARDDSICVLNVRVVARRRHHRTRVSPRDGWRHRPKPPKPRRRPPWTRATCATWRSWAPAPAAFAAALALQRRGYDVRVFERREAFRPAGVAVFIWPHGLEHLKRIDAATAPLPSWRRVPPIDTIAVERLDPGATEPEELLTINVAGWSERMDLPPQIGITWARLTDALRAGLEPGTIRLGHALDGVRDDAGEGVTLTFAPTRSGAPAPPPARARLCVVGADGRDSRRARRRSGRCWKTLRRRRRTTRTTRTCTTRCAPTPPVTERTDS